MKRPDYAEAEVEQIERIVSCIDTSSCIERIPMSHSKHGRPPVCLLELPASENAKAHSEDFLGSMEDKILV